MATPPQDPLYAAESFINTHARPLEQARFNCAFKQGQTAEVLEALATFQNPDGGFSHGLEPDLRTPESSALCTSIAFQIFREIKAPADHHMIIRGIDYLLQTFDHQQCTWRIIPPAAENSPRAPWWYQSGQEERLATFSLNPTAEILGYLFASHSSVPTEITTQIWNQVYIALQSTSSLEMHDLLCCLRLSQTPALPTEKRHQLIEQLKRLTKDTISCDPASWTGYCLRPLQVIDHPDSPFMPGFEEAVAANLDYELSTQNPDGSWTPTWSWDATYPEDWKIAQKEWSGVLTIEKLLTLKKFKKLH